MKFFIDTADVKETRGAAAIAPVSAEVVGPKYSDMLREARECAGLQPKVVAQMPGFLGHAGSARGEGRRDPSRCRWDSRSA